jgi:hypothetical protein
MNDFISNYRSERHERRPHTRVGKSATANLAESDETTTSIGSALREHWPEYLIEGWARTNDLGDSKIVTNKPTEIMKEPSVGFPSTMVVTCAPT